MLPFDAEVLFSFFAQYNRAIWPAQAFAWLLGAAALIAAFKPFCASDRLIGAVLLAAWAFSAVVFQYLHFAAINFMAPFYAAFFLAEAALIAWALVLRERTFRFRPGLAGWAGLGLAVFALVIHPLIDGLAGHGWRGARLVGATPGATALFTVGMLLLARGRAPLYLLVMPLLWSMVDGATAWLLDTYEDLVLPALLFAGVCLIVREKWRRRAGG
jgi:hypothetical protein